MKWEEFVLLRLICFGIYLFIYLFLGLTRADKTQTIFTTDFLGFTVTKKSFSLKKWMNDIPKKGQQTMNEGGNTLKNGLWELVGAYFKIFKGSVSIW